MQGVLKTFSELRRGGALVDLDEAMAAVVKAVVATGKVGRVTLNLDIRQLGKGGALTVTDTISTKVPKLPVPDTVFFATEEGELVKEDPKQIKMDLRAVEEKKEELRDVV